MAHPFHVWSSMSLVLLPFDHLWTTKYEKTHRTFHKPIWVLRFKNTAKGKVVSRIYNPNHFLVKCRTSAMSNDPQDPPSRPFDTVLHVQRMCFFFLLFLLARLALSSKCTRILYTSQQLKASLLPIISSELAFSLLLSFSQNSLFHPRSCQHYLCSFLSNALLVLCRRNTSMPLTQSIVLTLFRVQTLA